MTLREGLGEAKVGQAERLERKEQSTPSCGRSHGMDNLALPQSSRGAIPHVREPRR